MLVLASAAGAAAQSPRPDRAASCAQLSLARPEMGAPYRGAVRNDDYKLTLTIPGGLTGWGADPLAPFHGFTIFLPSPDEQTSCIVFEIHLRIDLGQQEARRRGRKATMGGATAWRREVTGSVGRTGFTNVTVEFSAPRRQEISDGTVRLVTPTKDLNRNMPIFDTFLSQIRFDPQ